MISQLYTFSTGSYVVATEWNENFNTVLEANLLHEEAIEDANDVILFTGGDYSAVYTAVNNSKNSFEVAGTSVVPSVDCEYYKDLVGDSDQLSVIVTTGQLSGEARVIIETHNDRTLAPIVITYNGSTDDVVWPNGIAYWYTAGMKFVFLLERNGKLYVKMIATE